MKYLKSLLLLISFLASISLIFFPINTCRAQEDFESGPVDKDILETEYLQGEISEIIEEKNIELEGKTQTFQKIKINVTKGSLTGKEIIVENGSYPVAQEIIYKTNDKVIISYSKNFEGSDVFFITDYIRTDGIVVLFLFFIFVALIIGSTKGFFSLLSLVISFIILFIFVLPQIQAGKDPVLIAILASIVIVPITFYLSHGFEKKTTVAIFGTFISLIITGILSSIFVNITHLAGTSSEESMFLQELGTHVTYNLKGLLLAGIIIGTLGVMDDITVSQTAIVYQLHDLKKDLSFAELFKRSIKIGKDHIASMINTLILVYTGASLPLLLLFMNNPRPFQEIINMELITSEIVKTLVGSIGLILAVPVTTYLACYFIKRTYYLEDTNN